MNRNYEEELVIPTGPDNKLEPGTCRIKANPLISFRAGTLGCFASKCPRIGGKRTGLDDHSSHGRTEKAYGSLQSDEEILERLIMTRGNLSPGLDDPNKPPASVCFSGRMRAWATLCH